MTDVRSVMTGKRGISICPREVGRGGTTQGSIGREGHRESRGVLWRAQSGGRRAANVNTLWGCLGVKE